MPVTARPEEHVTCIDRDSQSEALAETLRINDAQEPERDGNAEQAADSQEETVLPLDMSSERPKVRGLNADAAGHHQRNGFQRFHDVEQNSAGACREGKAREAGYEGAGKDCNAEQQEWAKLDHVRAPWMMAVETASENVRREGVTPRGSALQEQLQKAPRGSGSIPSEVERSGLGLGTGQRRIPDVDGKSVNHREADQKGD